MTQAAAAAGDHRSPARWVDLCRTGGSRPHSGVAVFPDPRDHADPTWFVTDWGVVTVGPFRKQGRHIARGQSVMVRTRVIVHDGDTATAGIANRHEAYVAALPLTVRPRRRRGLTGRADSFDEHLHHIAGPEEDRGSRKKPTPSGVPVDMMSPGDNGVNPET